MIFDAILKIKKTIKTVKSAGRMVERIGIITSKINYDIAYSQNKPQPYFPYVKQLLRSNAVLRIYTISIASPNEKKR